MDFIHFYTYILYKSKILYMVIVMFGPKRFNWMLLFVSESNTVI